MSVTTQEDWDAVPDKGAVVMPPLAHRLQAAVRMFALAGAPVEGFVAGRVASLDHGPLRFGGLYRVTERIASNRGGRLEPGQKLRFLGADVPSKAELLVCFETAQGAPVTLHFDGDAPQEADARRYFRDPAAHLRPVALDLSKRGKQLIAASAVLLHIKANKVGHG